LKNSNQAIKLTKSKEKPIEKSDIRVWFSYLTTLVGTTLIVLGLAILPLYIGGSSGLVAFLGAGLVFVSSTFMYLVHSKDYQRVS